MPYNVITHSGKAHIDEILAIAVLAVYQGEQPEEILRLPSDDVAEMVNAGDVAADTWVVDCGLMLDSNRRLFDHHQDGTLPSAALLMFRHLFPELEGSDLSGYFELVSKVDTGGLRSLEDIDSVGESRDYWSFPQQVLVRVFEKDPAAVVNLVSVGLADKIEFEEEKTAAAEWVAVPGRLVDVKIGGLTALEYTEHPPESLVNGLKGIDREVIQEHQAAVIYGYDKTDPTVRTLYRTDIGHDLVDFTRSKPAEMLFNHQGGFLLRFKPADPEEWKRIVRASALGSPREI
jgi:hypothetical protein